MNTIQALYIHAGKQSTENNIQFLSPQANQRCSVRIRIEDTVLEFSLAKQSSEPNSHSSNNPTLTTITSKLTKIRLKYENECYLFIQDKTVKNCLPDLPFTGNKQIRQTINFFTKEQ